MIVAGPFVDCTALEVEVPNFAVRILVVVVAVHFVDSDHNYSGNVGVVVVVVDSLGIVIRN